MVPRKHAEEHPHISMEFAASEAGYFLPEAVLHVNRLRLLCQIMRYPEESLLDIINDNWKRCGAICLGGRVSKKRSSGSEMFLVA